MQVKIAEAAAEARYLSGVGVAKQRKAIMVRLVWGNGVMYRCCMSGACRSGASNLHRTNAAYTHIHTNRTGSARALRTSRGTCRGRRPRRSSTSSCSPTVRVNACLWVGGRLLSTSYEVLTHLTAYFYTTDFDTLSAVGNNVRPRHVHGHHRH